MIDTSSQLLNNINPVAKKVKQYLLVKTLRQIREVGYLLSVYLKKNIQIYYILIYKLMKNVRPSIFHPRFCYFRNDKSQLNTTYFIEVIKFSSHIFV